MTSLHSNRSQNQRQAALDGFRDGTYQIMVATDIAARGIDVDRISHVINYDIPDTADAYIHRIGRTGRAEREGDAFTLITPEDDVMVRTIERAVGQRIARQTIAGFDYNAPAPAFTPSPPPHGTPADAAAVASAAAPGRSTAPSHRARARARGHPASRATARRAAIGATRASFNIVYISVHTNAVAISATAFVCYLQDLCGRLPR